MDYIQTNMCFIKIYHGYEELIMMCISNVLIKSFVHLVHKANEGKKKHLFPRTKYNFVNYYFDFENNARMDKTHK